MRERVASRLGWHETASDKSEDMKRRHSIESEEIQDIKKLKNESVLELESLNCENLVREPKSEIVGQTEPILDRIKLAKCLLRDPVEVRRGGEGEGGEGGPQPAPPLRPPQSEPPNQCLVQANSLLLDKVYNRLVLCRKLMAGNSITFP